jgi:hypothetical protein
LLVKHHPSTSGTDKKAKSSLIEKHLKTLSWKRVETFDLEYLREGYSNILRELEGRTAYGYEETSDTEQLEAGLLSDSDDTGVIKAADRDEPATSNAA